MSIKTRIDVHGRVLDINVYGGACLADLPDLADEDYHYTSDVMWSYGDSYSVHRWTLSDGRYLYIDLHDGNPMFANIRPDDIVRHLADWDCAGELAEWVSRWDVDPSPILRAAGANWAGKCRVWRQPHYYAGSCNAPVGRYARGDAQDTDDILEFASLTEAKEYVRAYYDAPSGYEGIPACNVMAHGQYSADALTICCAD